MRCKKCAQMTSKGVSTVCELCGLHSIEVLVEIPALPDEQAVKFLGSLLTPTCCRLSCVVNSRQVI